MRLLSWNVNGIKTLLQYSPWNTLKTYENVLNDLGADIVCFQETKITRKQVERPMAVLPSYDSFFSSYSRKPEKGYSGTCIFTKRAVTVPIRAEEGISGILPQERKPDPPREDELIGGTLGPDSIALNMQDVRTIDLEGRTTIVDLGLFVLINVYCPNETNEERLDFKLAFNAMLEARILNLIRLGREVVVVGDLNICAQPIDHCDPVRRMKDSVYDNFEDHPARKWFNEFVAPGTGTMVDLGRHFYPTRKSMFTHWETRINARETDYGTRIDYILATPGLLPWIKTCEIQPHVIGSDHCPVIADFYESITTPEGKVLYLFDHVNPPGRSKEPGAPAPEPPRLAAKNYSDFGSEQKLLSTFFGKRPASAQAPPVSEPPRKNSATPVTASIAATSSTSASTSAKPGIAPQASAPLPSTLLDDPIALSTAQPIVPIAGPSSSANGKLQRATSTTTLASGQQSPSIDLTADHTDSDTEVKPASKTRQKSAANKAEKRKRSQSPQNGTSNSKRTITQPKGKNGQRTLATFFKPPTPALEVKSSGQTNGKSSATDRKGKGRSPNLTSTEAVAAAPVNTESVITSGEENTADDEIVVDASLHDLKARANRGGRLASQSRTLANETSKRSESVESSNSSDIQDMMEGSTAASNEQASAAWSSLFTPKTAPLCSMHGEPCKQWTVNKSGKNKGRVFWLCARPVGEGYDKGQSKADVNPEFRCNYFKWESDLKRTAPGASPGGQGRGTRKR